jgi:hypothetical protein
MLVAIARIRNEDDIVEAFVRHHAAMVDRLILLDNDSNDRTRAILQALKQEGLPITLFASRSIAFAEAAHNTFLARQAVALGADWIVCLDCDEFVDQRHIPGGLRDYLAAKPHEVLHLHAGLVNYIGTEADDRSEAIVPVRIRHRDRDFCATKVFVRALLVRHGAALENGNHNVVVHGVPLGHQRDHNLVLAHYPMRSGWQMLAKAVVGRLKVLAAGAAEGAAATHYTDLLSNFEAHPEYFDRTFADARRAVGAAIVADAIDYLGGALRYTIADDTRVHAVLSVLKCAEALARRHGALLDRTGEVRDQTRAWDNEISQVF